MKLFLKNKVNTEVLSHKKLQKIAEGVLKLKKQPTHHISLSLYFVDAREIQSINSEYRHKDKATDVITFRLLDTASGKILNKKNFPLDYEPRRGLYLGEIFICLEVAEKQAIEMGHSVQREVAELFVHGMLHILGHDHEEPAEAENMKKFEEAMYPLLDKLVG